MASLAKFSNFVVPIAKNHHRVIFNAVRTKVKTKFDWMPGPYPQTEEDYKRAAERYGLHRAEYKPYPDDGMWPTGDYPLLPYKAHSLNDPFYPWDDPGERRNFGEVVHYQRELLTQERTDIGQRTFYTKWQPFYTFYGMCAIAFFLNWLADFYPNFQPRLAKSWPQEGVEHYGF